MKSFFSRIFILFLLTAHFSCQREIFMDNIDNIAAGSLQDNATRECLPKTIAGNYVMGKTLTDNDFIQVNVDVTATGPYNISTDVTNGYSFSGSGIFTTKGINTIKLKARGTPLASGTDLFIIIFDSTLCLLSIPVLP